MIQHGIALSSRSKLATWPLMAWNSTGHEPPEESRCSIETMLARWPVTVAVQLVALAIHPCIR